MFPVETQEFRLHIPPAGFSISSLIARSQLYENLSPDTLYMPQNFHLVSLKILEFYRRKIFNQWVSY